MSASSRLTIVLENLEFPESPVCSVRDGCLYLVEWLGDRVTRVRAGQAEPLFGLGEGSGPSGLCQVNDGSFWVCQYSGRELVHYNPSGERLETVRHFNGVPFRGTCDLVADRNGGIYFSDSGDFEEDWRSGRAVGAIYRLGGEGGLIQLDRDLCYPNGMGLSPNEETLYVNEHRSNRTLAYSLGPDGRITEKGIFHSYDSECKLAQEDCFQLGPDGLCVAENGEVWVAHYGGGKVIRLDPMGEVLEFVHLPLGCKPTSAVFSSAEQALYITEAECGLLYRYELN